MRLLPCVWAVSVCFAGNIAAPDPSLLARIQARVRQNLARLPDYTCTQTIERSTRRGPRESWRTTDLVRLEVAYVGDQELFGYPGGEKLDEAEITRLVPTGAIGSGDFATLARDVFANPGAAYFLVGSVRYKGRSAIRCDYTVPVSASHYQLRVPPRESVVGYHGSFWVDETTLDLLRLDVSAGDIPAQLGLSNSRLVTDYAQVAFGEKQFSLPHASELLVRSDGGLETRNETSFAACRQFRGESVMMDDDPPLRAPAPSHAQILRARLPRDFSAALTLDTPIDSATAAVGDAVQFRLCRDLKHGHAVIVPRGATFAGRILRLEHGDNQFGVAFRLEAVEFGTFRADLRSRRNVCYLNEEPGLVAFSSLTREDRGAGALITVLTDHLRWPRGFHFSLRSRIP